MVDVVLRFSDVGATRLRPHAEANTESDNVALGFRFRR